MALDHLRSVVDFSAIKSFVVSRGASEDAWDGAVWREILLTDGRR